MVEQTFSLQPMVNHVRTGLHSAAHDIPALVVLALNKSWVYAQCARADKHTELRSND